MEPHNPRDDLEFLVRSKHRVSVLELLAEAPATRRDLEDRSGISQPTLGRILGHFEERGWSTHEGRTYRLTPFGELLGEEVVDLLETMEMLGRFGEVAPHLPLDELGFDLRQFRHARITLPRADDVLVHIRRGAALLADADRVRTLSPSIYPEMLRELRDRLRVRDQLQEAILSGAALEAMLADPELVAWTREILDAEAVSIYRTEEAIPLPMGVVDDTAFLTPLDQRDIPCALVESENDRIRSWVVERLDGYRDRASEVTVADLLS